MERSLAVRRHVARRPARRSRRPDQAGAESNPLDTSLKSGSSGSTTAGQLDPGPDGPRLGLRPRAGTAGGVRRVRQFCSTYVERPADPHRPAVHNQGRVRERWQPRPRQAACRSSSRTSTTSTWRTSTGSRGSSEGSRAQQPRRHGAARGLEVTGSATTAPGSSSAWCGPASPSRSTGSDEGPRLRRRATAPAGLPHRRLDARRADPRHRPRGSLTFSPGDIDEAITSLIDLGTPKDIGATTDGGLFRLVASLRSGVVDGFDSCGLN